MNKMLLALVAVLALAVPASAETFTSAEYGFTIDFPNPPSATTPQPSEKDAAGNTISMYLMFNGSRNGVYYAAVAVDSFIVDYSVDVAGSLLLERDNYVKTFEASLDDSRTATLDGQPAVFFSYSKADQSARGRGVVAIIPGARPRIYVAAVAYNTQAAGDDLAALDRFIDSFHLIRN